MLYVFHGSDTHKVADRANALVAALREKQPDAGVYFFEDAFEDISPLDELVEARGLFVSKHIVVLKGVCEKKESRELVFERLSRFAESEHVFVLAEGSVHIAHKKLFAEHADKVEEHTKPSVQKGFDPYGVARAVKERKRRELWVAFLRARRGGESPEALAGLMHWAVKNMLHTGAARYGAEELRTLSRQLIEHYHEAHQGRYELEPALEQWVLTI